MVTIGHASIDENGKAHGGQAGDQTGKEVCTRSWYNKPWPMILRPDADIADKMADACLAGCNNNNIGYDQYQRNTLHTEAKKVGYDLSKVGKCETDCSAFMTVCALAAGVTALEYTSNAPTTSTMRNAFVRTGKFQALTDSKYLTSDKYLKRGDILLSPGSHTAMVLTNGNMVNRKSVEEIAQEVIDGKWGVGTARRQMLEAAGYNYKEVQAEVNKRMKNVVEHVSQKGVDLIKKWEGLRLVAYRLPGEINWTIGYGHSSPDIKADARITQQEAEKILREDLVTFERYVKKYAKIPLTQPRLDALVSYTYNRGPGGMKELANNCKTVEEYADGIVKYWGKAERYKDALLRRRKEERELFLS